MSRSRGPWVAGRVASWLSVGLLATWSLLASLAGVLSLIENIAYSRNAALDPAVRPVWESPISQVAQQREADLVVLAFLVGFLPGLALGMVSLLARQLGRWAAAYFAVVAAGAVGTLTAAFLHVGPVGAGLAHYLWPGLFALIPLAMLAGAAWCLIPRRDGRAVSGSQA